MCSILTDWLRPQHKEALTVAVRRFETPVDMNGIQHMNGAFYALAIVTNNASVTSLRAFRQTGHRLNQLSRLYGRPFVERFCTVWTRLLVVWSWVTLGLGHRLLLLNLASLLILNNMVRSVDEEFPGQRREGCLRVRNAFQEHCRAGCIIKPTTGETQDGFKIRCSNRS